MNDNVLKDMYDVIEDRRKNPEEGSYTCYLFNQGIDKILKKVGEECAETIIAAKNGNKDVYKRQHSRFCRNEGRNRGFDACLEQSWR